MILGKCPIIEESWNDELKLTEEVIQSIKEYVEEFNEDSLF